MEDKERERKYEVVREVVGDFPETSIEANVDPDTGVHVFLIQVATAEQALRLEIDGQWLADHSEAQIEAKLSAYGALEKLRTSGGMAVKVNYNTCP